MKPPETFETKRLRLRPPTLEDAEAIFTGYAQDGEVTKYLMWKPHKSIEETKDFLRQRCIASWQSSSGYPYAMIRKEDGKFLGMVEIRFEGFSASIGYVLAKSFWKQGYMSEAVKALVDWGLAQREVFRVWAICDVDNLASARVMEKVGMDREGVLRRRVSHPNISSEPRDAFSYAIVK